MNSIALQDLMLYDLLDSPKAKNKMAFDCIITADIIQPSGFYQYSVFSVVGKIGDRYYKLCDRCAMIDYQTVVNNFSFLTLYLKKSGAVCLISKDKNVKLFAKYTTLSVLEIDIAVYTND